MVDVSVEKIVYLFGQEYTPAKICSAIKMCQDTDVQDIPPVSSNDINRFNPPSRRREQVSWAVLVYTSWFHTHHWSKS